MSLQNVPTNLPLVSCSLQAQTPPGLPWSDDLALRKANILHPALVPGGTGGWTRALPTLTIVTELRGGQASLASALPGFTAQQGIAEDQLCLSPPEPC